MNDVQINEQMAVNAALSNNWDEAIRINSALLKEDKDNTNILNRLGFAYLQNGKLSEAKKTFQKVITIDEYNSIAQKNLKKLTTLKQKDIVNTPSQLVSPLVFLEEPGKTKMVECINAAPLQTLVTLSPGQAVMLKAKNHVVEIRTEQNLYLGALPDDISFRLIKYLQGGNTYQVLIKSIGKNTFSVFIREHARGKQFSNQPTFSANGFSMPFTKTTDNERVKIDDESSEEE